MLEYFHVTVSVVIVTKLMSHITLQLQLIIYLHQRSSPPPHLCCTMLDTRSNKSTTWSSHQWPSPSSALVAHKCATSSVGTGSKEKKPKKDNMQTRKTMGEVKETAGKGKKQQR